MLMYFSAVVAISVFTASKMVVVAVGATVDSHVLDLGALALERHTHPLGRMLGLVLRFAAKGTGGHIIPCLEYGHTKA